MNNLPLEEAYRIIHEVIEGERPMADIQTSEYFTVVDIAREARMSLDDFLALSQEERDRIAAHAKVKAMMDFCATNIEKLKV